MNESDFEKELIEALEQNKSSISDHLDGLIQNLTEKITGIDIGIFTSQDGDGHFSIYANAIGPDLYVRQKEIKEFANLFNPKYTTNGLEPHIPTLDPFEVDFYVNDLIVDVVATWFQSSFSDKSYPENVVFRIVSPEDYGTVTPIELS